jgi:hypothetical protein
MTNAIQKRWAFLVGIDHYDDPGYRDLNFCVNDVQTLGQLLKVDLGYERVVCLHDNPSEDRYKPTRDNIEAELGLLCELVGPDDLLLVHFACHGIRVGDQPCLITSEIRSYNYKNRVLPVAEVEQKMRDSGARCKVLFLDACHTGVDMGRDLADPEFIRNVYEQAEGFALIAASTAQQKAFEWGHSQHGLFTYHLLEALTGKADFQRKGFVSIKDIENYVLDRIKRWNQETGMVQTPTARVEGFGDMILAYYPEQMQTQFSLSSGGSARSNSRTGQKADAVPVSQPEIPVTLTPQQMKSLQAALISAFPQEDDLAIMVQYYLQTALNRISMAKAYDKIIFDLIQWVNARGKVANLINGALETNSDNPDLLKFMRSLQP